MKTNNTITYDRQFYLKWYYRGSWLNQLQMIARNLGMTGNGRQQAFWSSKFEYQLINVVTPGYE